MISTFASYNQIIANLPRATKTAAADPTVARATKYYQANISSVKTVDDFLKNDRLFTYAMKAFNLGDMAYAKGFMRRVLEGGVSDSRSLANTLTDSRYRIFANAFNFVASGATATASVDATTGTVDRYIRQSLETTAGSQNEGVRLALYFQRKASSISSAYSILADKALLKVVQTALNIPAESSKLDIDRQAEMIKAKLPIADLKDAAKLTKFLERFSALYDAQQFDPLKSPSVSLVSQSSEQGISVDLMMSLQSIGRGR